jgi:hypothetical protein
MVGSLKRGLIKRLICGHLNGRGRLNGRNTSCWVRTTGMFSNVTLMAFIHSSRSGFSRPQTRRFQLRGSVMAYASFQVRAWIQSTTETSLSDRTGRDTAPGSGTKLEQTTHANRGSLIWQMERRFCARAGNGCRNQGVSWVSAVNISSSFA